MVRRLCGDGDARRAGSHHAHHPADDQVLAAALAAGADLIVSGDAHLLDLKGFKGIEIVTAAVAVERLSA